MFKKEEGFTLIEMLIVLMIISVLIILIVPNLGDQSKSANKKGCEALEEVIQAQTDAYFLDNQSYPSSVSVLNDKGYISKNQKTCKDGTTFKIDTGNGEVTSE